MTDLFKPDQNPTEPFADPNKDYLTELVGDGKKFKTPNDLARGKAESDAFIGQLQGELKGLREELKTRLTMEELTDKFSKIIQEQPPGNVGNTNASEPNGDIQSIKPDDISKLMDSKLSEFEKSRRREENSAYVQNELRKIYGDNYATRLEQEAGKLGLSKDFLNNLAADQPKAFMQMFSKTPQTNVETGAAPQSKIAVGFTPSSGDRTEKFYEQMRKEKPTEYWSPKVQMQMHNDAIRQGENFFDAEHSV